MPCRLSGSDHSPAAPGRSRISPPSPTTNPGHRLQDRPSPTMTHGPGPSGWRDAASTLESRPATTGRGRGTKSPRRRC